MVTSICPALLSELSFPENIRHLHVCIGATMLINYLQFNFHFNTYCFHQSESYASPLYRVCGGIYSFIFLLCVCTEIDGFSHDIWPITIYICRIGSQEGAISDAEVSLCDLIADYQAIEEKQSNDWSKLSAGLNKNGEISPFVQLFPAFWCEPSVHYLSVSQ